MTTETYHYMTEAQRTQLLGFVSDPNTYIDGVYFTANTKNSELCIRSYINDPTDGKWYGFTDTIYPDGRTESSPSYEVNPEALGLPVKETA